MMKSSLIRTFSLNSREQAKERKVTNHLVRMHLVDKYELRSVDDIIEFDVREEDGVYERGVYKIKVFGQGDTGVKVLQFIGIIQAGIRKKKY